MSFFTLTIIVSMALLFLAVVSIIGLIAAVFGDDSGGAAVAALATVFTIWLFIHWMIQMRAFADAGWWA